MENSLLQLVICAIIALIPAIIWLGFLFQKGEAEKKLLGWIFLGGAFAVVPLWILDNLWNPETPRAIIGLFQRFTENPQIISVVEAVTDKIWFYSVKYDVFSFLGNSIEDQHMYFVGIFIVVGVLEEIVKQMMLRSADKRTLLIKTVNDSIKFSFVAGLGFSFAENIKYFYQIWSVGGISELMVPYVFRSIFTACAHMVFSGIFGYYYGIGKFSIDYTEQQKWQNKKKFSTLLLRRIFKISESQMFKEQMILKGLIIAIVMHAVFNFLLQLNIILPVIIYIVAAFAFLLYLLKRKTGQLVLITDVSSNKTKAIGKKDEDVVIELLGMWFNQNKFVDVIHICERLLKRDPNNNVVKLFKAKAMDKLEEGNAYKKVLNTVLSDERIGIGQDKSVIAKHVANKPQQKQKDFQETEEFKKFKEQEREKKLKDGTFNLDV
jgi:RsiW-degrading membrane proteinase PrsW (M82 family)